MTPDEDPGWSIRLDVDESNAIVAVAISSSGDEVGMASAGSPRDEDAGAAWELYVLNVVSEARGGGVADRLHERVVGRRESVVWVLVDNARARGFYARHGYVADGRTRSHEASGHPEMRMVRRVAASSD